MQNDEYYKMQDMGDGNTPNPQLDKKTEEDLTKLFKKLATASTAGEQVDLLESWRQKNGLGEDFILKWVITKEILIAKFKSNEPTNDIDKEVIKIKIEKNYTYLAISNFDEVFDECSKIAKEIEKQKTFGKTKDELKESKTVLGALTIASTVIGVISAGAVIGWSFALAKSKSTGLKIFAGLSMPGAVLSLALFSVVSISGAYAYHQSFKKDKGLFAAKTEKYWEKRFDEVNKTAKALGADLIDNKRRSINLGEEVKIPQKVQAVFETYGVDITNIHKHKEAMGKYKEACEKTGLDPMYLVYKEASKCLGKIDKIMSAKSQGKGQGQ